MAVFPWLVLQSIVSGGGLSPAALMALGFRFPRKESVGNVVEGKRLPVRRRFDGTENEFRFRFPRRDEKPAGKEDCGLSPVDTGKREGCFPVCRCKLAQGGKHPGRKGSKIPLGGFAGVEVRGGGITRIARLGKPAVRGAGEARRIVRLQRNGAGGLLGGFVVFGIVLHGCFPFVRDCPRRGIARGLDCSPACAEQLSRVVRYAGGGG